MRKATENFWLSAPKSRASPCSLDSPSFQEREVDFASISAAVRGNRLPASFAILPRSEADLQAGRRTQRLTLSKSFPDTDRGNVVSEAQRDRGFLLGPWTAAAHVP